MNDQQTLIERAHGHCELCAAEAELSLYDVAGPAPVGETTILICAGCGAQLGEAGIDPDSWQGLSERIWSPIPAVQVMAWRILKRINSETWAQDLLDMVYLDDETQAWAEAQTLAAPDNSIATVDSNGAALQAGDSVTLIKDLEVKGAGFTAKRGTAVRNISLTDNPEHIEGRVNGTRIVLLTRFLKKSG